MWQTTLIWKLSALFGLLTFADVTKNLAEQGVEQTSNIMIPACPPILIKRFISKGSLLVSISESSKLLLACSIPNIKFNSSMIGVENHRVDFYSKGGNIFLLKFSCQMALYECGLSYSSISNKNKFKFWCSCLSFHFYKNELILYSIIG